MFLKLFVMIPGVCVALLPPCVDRPPLSFLCSQLFNLSVLLVWVLKYQLIIRSSKNEVCEVSHKQSIDLLPTSPLCWLSIRQTCFI